MSIVELFNVVTEEGRYRIGYIEDGWTQEFICNAGSPSEAMMLTQNYLGNIGNVSYIEKE